MPQTLQPSFVIRQLQSFHGWALPLGVLFCLIILLLSVHEWLFTVFKVRLAFVYALRYTPISFQVSHSHTNTSTYAGKTGFTTGHGQASSSRTAIFIQHSTMMLTRACSLSLLFGRLEGMFTTSSTCFLLYSFFTSFFLLFFSGLRLLTFFYILSLLPLSSRSVAAFSYLSRLLFVFSIVLNSCLFSLFSSFHSHLITSHLSLSISSFGSFCLFSFLSLLALLSFTLLFSFHIFIISLVFFLFSHTLFLYA